jgi:hypothetical protein
MVTKRNIRERCFTGNHGRAVAALNGGTIQ